MLYLSDEDLLRDMPAQAPPPEPTGLLEAGVLGLGRGAVSLAGAATLAVGGVYGAVAKDPYGMALGDTDKNEVFDFYQQYIEPAKTFYTPDPESLSTAGKIVGGVAGLAVPLMLGPAAAPAIIGSSTFDTATELLDAGVDARTATAEGILSGVFTAAMVEAPASGKTLAQTLALVAANPALGAVQAEAQKVTLNAAGYGQQAEAFDPYDPAGRTLDLLMGAIFGGLGHFGRARARMPIQFEDALDTAALAQKAGKSNPLHGAKNVLTHVETLTSAVNDLVEGRPVDVAQVQDNLKAADVRTPAPDADTVAAREVAGAETKAVEAYIRGYEKAAYPEPDDTLHAKMETGDFGPIFTEFKGKPQEAVDHLLKVKEGEAVGALHHKNVGEIGLVWGKEGTPEKDYKDGYGLAKIAIKHPEVMGNLQEVIDEMGVKSKSANRAILESSDHKAAVRLDWNGETKHWLVSAYKKSDTSHTEGSTYGSGSKGDKPTPLPQDVSNINIPPSGDKVKGASKAKGFNPETHSLADFVRQQGGLSTEKEYLKGELRDRFSIKEGYGLINNKKGMTLERMFEAARDEGFFKQYDPHAAYDPAGEDTNTFLDRLAQDVDAKQRNEPGKRVWSQKKQGTDVEHLVEYNKYLESQSPEKLAKMFEGVAPDLLPDEPWARDLKAYLAEHGDTPVEAGTDADGRPIMKTATELIDETMADITKAEDSQGLFDIAAECLASIGPDVA